MPSKETVEEYFISIRRLFSDARQLREEEGKYQVLKGTTVGLFVLSVLPLVPYLLRYVVTRYKLIHGLKVHEWTIPVNSFWFWWSACFVGTLLLMLGTFRLLRPSPELQKNRLSPQQLRFAYCYSLADEIRNFQTNRLQRHLDKAIEYARELGEFLWRSTVPFPVPGSADVYLSIEGQPHSDRDFRIQEIFSRRPKWYRLQPETEEILRAFREFLPKYLDRLRDKKDLATLNSALEDLAEYFYTEIPEIAPDSSEAQREMEAAGMVALMKFVAKTNGLAPYRSEAIPSTAKEDVARKVAFTGSRLAALFVHHNVLVSFFAWYFLLLLICSSAAWAALRYVAALKLDSVMVTSLIGVPLLGAITATTIPRIGRDGKKEN